uniref:Protein kinase domain-containing protein n=1 Tax=Panagrellus redivivus TaxID=6233 RepID=A0A7E4V9R9_PANRE
MGSWFVLVFLVSSLYSRTLSSLTTKQLTPNQQTYAFVLEGNATRGDDEHLSEADTYLIPSAAYTLNTTVVIPESRHSINGITPDATLTLSLHARKVCDLKAGILTLKITFDGGFTLVTAKHVEGRFRHYMEVRCSQEKLESDFSTFIDLLPGANLIKLPTTCLGSLKKYRDGLAGVEVEVLDVEGCYPVLVAAYPSVILEENTDITLIQPPGPWYNAVEQAPVDVPVWVDGELNHVEINLTKPTNYSITFGRDPTAKFPIMRFYVDENITDFATTIRFFDDPTCELFITVEHHIVSFETSGTKDLPSSNQDARIPDTYKPHAVLRRWHADFPKLYFLEDSYDRGGIFAGGVQLCSGKKKATHQFVSLQVVDGSVKGECAKCVLIVGGSLESEYHKVNLIGFSIPEDASQLGMASVLSMGLIIGIALLALGLCVILASVYIAIHTYRKRKYRRAKAHRAELLQAQARLWAEEEEEEKKKKLLTSTDVNSNRSPGTLSRIIALEKENGPISKPPQHVPKVIVPKASKVHVVDDLVSRERSSDNKTDEVIVPTEFDYHGYENFETYSIAGIRPYQSEPPMALTAFQDFWDIFDYFMSNEHAMPVAAMGAKNENVYFSVRDCVAVPRKGFRSLANRMLEPINPKLLPVRKPDAVPAIVIRIFVLSYDPPWIEVHCRGPPPPFMFTIFDCQECQKFGTQLDDTAGLISDALMLKPWKEFCCEVKRLELDRHRFVSYCNGGYVQPKNAGLVDHLLTIRGRGNSPALPKCTHGCTVPTEAIGHPNEKELHCFVLNGVKSLPGTRFTQINGDGTVVPTGLPPPPKKQSAICAPSSVANASEAPAKKKASVPVAITPPNTDGKPPELPKTNTSTSPVTADQKVDVAVPPLDAPSAVNYDSTRAKNSVASRTAESAKESKDETRTAKGLK